MLLKSTQKICADLLFPKQNGKSSVIKSALYNHFYSSCFCLFIFLLVSINSFAQFDPRVNCTNGCTSNDIQIKTAYLVDRTTHAALPSNFQCQGTASVKLALELTTKTPRVGVYIYARVVNKNTLAELEIVSECFSTSLESVAPLTTKVVFNELVGWPCGTPIILKDVFIGWGTGNKDFCEGSPLERCPGTPSKCYSLPPGEYITVVVPTAASATSEKCSTTPGGTTASFNLELLNPDVIGSQQNVSVTWYSNTGLTTLINNPTNFVTGYTEVYAKVSNNSDPTVYSSSTVILNVFVTPVANAASSTLCSTGPGGTTASFNLTGLEAAVLNGQTGVTLAWYSDVGLQNAISSPYVTGSTTVYAKVSNNVTNCSSSVGVSLTVNRTPTVTSTSATLCSTTAGGSTASFDLSSLEAVILNGQSNVSIAWFSNVGLATPISSPHLTATTTVYAKTTNTNATSCTNSIAISLTVNSRPGTITANVTPPTCAVATGTITVTSSTAGLTFSLNSTNPANFTNATGVFGSLTPGSYVIRSKSAAGCISDGVTKEIVAAAGATPAADVVIVTNPSCSSSTGSLRVVQAGSHADYNTSIFEFSNGGAFTNNPVFSFKAGEGYSITVRRISDHTCFATTSCAGEAPIAEQGGTANSGSQLNQETVIAPLRIGIKAIPNPFSDRVRFAVTNERAGIGILDVFNMQGQKVKTVYSGYVPAGTSYYDLEVVGQSSGQLIYILRIGSEKLSGKLLQVNK